MRLKIVQNNLAAFKQSSFLLDTTKFRYIFLAVIIFIPSFSTFYLEVKNINNYKLSNPEKSLVSKSSVKSELIKTTEDAFTYNRKEELNIPNGDDPALRQLLLSANKAESTGKEPYQASISKDPTDGIIFGDAEGTRKFTLIPSFGMSVARMDEDNRIIYPRSSTERSIYTFKKNGIKNDITLLEAPSADPNTNGSIKTYKYTLDLGKELDAKQLPSGDIGIYSADPKFFGNIQTSDESSKALIEKARANSPKDTLVFEIPKPFIIDSSKKMNYEDVSFKLEPNQKDSTKPTLTIEVRNLNNLPYPLSIDPTITVTTTNDFQTNIGDTGNVDFSTSGQITRGSIGSGAVSAEGASSTMIVAREGNPTIAYNGFLYTAVGYHNTNDLLCGNTTSNYCDDLQYCPINANGTVGACTQLKGAVTNPRAYSTATVYNGYLYIIGGWNGATRYDDIHYCAINANGSITSCTRQTTMFTGGRYQHTSVVYNGYLYIVGGVTTINERDIHYCTIKSDGSIGSCTMQTNAFTGGRAGHSSVVFNGYLYVIGGWTTSAQNDIQYCPINANGSVGTCVQQASIIPGGGRYGHGSILYNGYLYIIGGSTTSAQNDIVYCPINANGSVGTCVQQTGAFTTARSNHGVAVYAGYIYIVSGNGATNDIRNVPIANAGRAGPTTQQNSAFTAARNSHASLVYKNYLYIVGGNLLSASTSCNTVSSDLCNDIQYCPINANGSVGTCTQQLGAFTGGRLDHTSVAYNNYIYIIGGTTNGIPGGGQNDIQYCPINANGSVGTCTQQTAIFTTPRSSHTSVVYNNYLYIIGGSNTSSVAQNDIIYCSINSNGSIGTCTRQTSAFATARSGHTSVTSNGYLYIIGGSLQGGNQLNGIIYCSINNNGSVGSCMTNSSGFTTARSGHTSIVYNGYIYVIGGDLGVNQANDIQYCPINSNGSVGTCTQQTSAFTSARRNHASTVYNGILYISGGDTAPTTFYNDIQYLRIGPPEGMPEASTVQTSVLSRNSHTSVAYGGYLYLIGGSDGTTNQNTITYCTINANGSLVTPCSTNSTGFTTARYAHASVVYNGYLYIIGGLSGTAQNDIQFCPINANGSVGACTQQTNAFTTARYYHTSVVYNGYIYIIGGTNGTNQNDIQYCPINSNGSVGACTQKTNAFTTARNAHASTVYNGYLYITGGVASGANYLNDIQYCPINADGSVDNCVQQSNAFFSARNGHSTFAYNGKLYIIAGNGNTYTTEIQYCDIYNNGSVGACAQKISAFNTGRTTQALAIYEGYLYISGGINSSLATISDVEYMPVGSVDNLATYERTIDTGSSANTIGSFVILGSELCGYTVKYQTAGSTNVYGALTTIPFVKSGSNIGVTVTNARYLRVSITIDDTTCRNNSSAITDIIVYYNDIPNAPTLLLPANNATGVDVLPEFRLGSSDENPYQKYFRYKIDVCSTATCTVIVRTIDQTSSQTGWAGQSQVNATAYGAGGSIVEYAIHKYQTAALSASTQYWWRGYAIDPEGSNTWSSASAISTFTTGSATPNSVNITSGTNITSGSKISP